MRTPEKIHKLLRTAASAVSFFILHVPNGFQRRKRRRNSLPRFEDDTGLHREHLLHSVADVYAHNVVVVVVLLLTQDRREISGFPMKKKIFSANACQARTRTLEWLFSLCFRFFSSSYLKTNFLHFLFLCHYLSPFLFFSLPLPKNDVALFFLSQISYYFSYAVQQCVYLIFPILIIMTEYLLFV